MSMSMSIAIRGRFPSELEVSVGGTPVAIAKPLPYGFAVRFVPSVDPGVAGRVLDAVRNRAGEGVYRTPGEATRRRRRRWNPQSYSEKAAAIIEKNTRKIR